jgi:hypothetical protein
MTRNIHINEALTIILAGKLKLVDTYSKDKNKRPMVHIVHLSRLANIEIFFSNIKYAFHFHLPHPTPGGNYLINLPLFYVRMLSCKIHLS